jgi:peptide deformylase
MSTAAGTARAITYYGEPVLHRPCATVTVFDAALEELIADMFASMYKAEGVGLAANQIGVDARIFVMDCPSEGEENVVAHVVNPVLHLPPAPRTLLTDGEGCLSIPGQHAEVARAATATVTGIDMHGQPVEITGSGWLARCLQHETDHLSGLLYVDRLPRKQRRRILSACGLAELPGN